MFMLVSHLPRFITHSNKYILGIGMISPVTWIPTQIRLLAGIFHFLYGFSMFVAYRSWFFHVIVNARDSNPLYPIVRSHIWPTFQLVNSHEISKLLRRNLTFLSLFFGFVWWIQSCFLMPRIKQLAGSQQPAVHSVKVWWFSHQKKHLQEAGNLGFPWLIWVYQPWHGVGIGSLPWGNTLGWPVVPSSASHRSSLAAGQWGGRGIFGSTDRFVLKKCDLSGIRQW